MVKQYRLVIVRMIQKVKKRRQAKVELRIRWWKLKEVQRQDQHGKEADSTLGKKVRDMEDWEDCKGDERCRQERTGSDSMVKLWFKSIREEKEAEGGIPRDEESRQE